ncbi:MAG: hypothetical protein RLZ12_331 [Bacillota bacterium]|jgi:hypothetical protein
MIKKILFIFSCFAFVPFSVSAGGGPKLGQDDRDSLPDPAVYSSSAAQLYESGYLCYRCPYVGCNALIPVESSLNIPSQLETRDLRTHRHVLHVHGVDMYKHIGDYS